MGKERGHDSRNVKLNKVRIGRNTIRSYFFLTPTLYSVTRFDHTKDINKAGDLYSFGPTHNS